VKRYEDTVTNEDSTAIVGATVTVRNQNGTVATIYSDNGITTKSNPTTTDGDGMFFFYAADGTYDIEISANGYSGATVENIVLNEGGVTSLAELRTINVDNDTDYKIVLGHTTAGDGGGGTFYWSASSADADDNGITILPTGHTGNGRWKRVYSGSVTPEYFGAVGDGVTNDYAAIQAAEDYLSAAGGGVIVFSKDIYKHNTALTKKPYTHWLMYGSTLLWGGGASVQITSSTSTVLEAAGIHGAIIDGGTLASTILELFSPFRCSFRDVSLKSNSSTNMALDIRVNTTGGTNPDGNRNAVNNYFSNLIQQGNCGTALRLKGEPGTPTVVTLNTFSGFEAQHCAVHGINFHSHCDNNNFSGVTRISLSANNAIGVEWNTGTPGSNVGVYSNNFTHLAVDAFGVMTGRVGIKMNWTKLNKVDYFFQDPAAEGGPYVFDAVNTASYHIVHVTAGTSNFVTRQKLSYQQGKDNPTLIVGGDDITTETVGIVAGVGRSGSGISKLDLIGDTTYTAYGLRAIRNSGANGTTQLLHRGTGNLDIKSEDNGQVVLYANNVANLSVGAAGVQLSTPTGGYKGVGTLNISADYYVNGTKVLGAQETGWTAGTGTANKAAFATYAGQNVSAAYVEAEAQATDDAAKANSQRIKAIEDALRTHGLIN